MEWSTYLFALTNFAALLGDSPRSGVSVVVSTRLAGAEFRVYRTNRIDCHGNATSAGIFSGTSAPSDSLPLHFHCIGNIVQDAAEPRRAVMASTSDEGADQGRDDGIHHGAFSVALHMPEDLQSLLGDEQKLPERPEKRQGPFRRRVGRRLHQLPSPGERERRRRAACGADGEAAGSSSGGEADPPPRGDHWEAGGSSSGSEAHPPPQNLLENGGGGDGGRAGDADGGAAGDGTDSEDELDQRPDILSAINNNEAFITQQLAMHLSGQTRARDILSSALCRAAAVADGAAVVISEVEKAFAVCLVSPRGVIVALCSCGGRRGAESADVRHMLDLSSSCVHARALMLSTQKLAEAAQVASSVLLLQRYPVLHNSQPEL